MEQKIKELQGEVSDLQGEIRGQKVMIDKMQREIDDLRNGITLGDR